MKFSIIVPVYKTEKYLKQCVESILSQSFTDFELVLVDNESPDNCPQMCEDFAKQDSRVRAIHKKHGTAASGRNFGIQSAKGEYLCFLDSDDWWVDNEVLAKINSKIEKSNPDILELYYKFHFDSTGKEMVPNEVDFTSFDALENHKKIEFLIKNDRLNPSAWGMCVLRSYLEACHGYFDESKVIEDIDWCLRLYSKSPKVDALADPVYVYRKNVEGSVTSTTKFKSVQDLCDIIEGSPKLLCEEKNPVHGAMMNYVTYQVMITTALTFSNNIEITREQKRETRKKLKSFCKRYLKEYHCQPKVRKAYIIYRLCGYRIMARVLGFYLNHRGR